MHFPVHALYNTSRSLRTIALIHTAPAIRHLSSGVSQTTSASSSKNPYPFPSHRNPTPHQIFHLDTTASDAQIKARYYELVKLFHPDTASQDGTPSKACQERFQRITAAYNHLRRSDGRSRLPSVSDIYRSGSGAQNRNRTWTGKRNEWGGFEYQYDDHFNVKGDPAASAAASGTKPTYEKTFHESDAPYWIFFAVAFVGGLVQFVFFSPAQEAARHNRKATQSLNDARQSREEHGAKRREGLKLWAEQQRRRKEELELAEGDGRLAQPEEDVMDAAAPVSSEGAADATR